MVAALPPRSLTLLDLGLNSSVEDRKGRPAFNGTALSAALARLSSLQQLRVTSLPFDCWPALEQLSHLTRLELHAARYRSDSYTPADASSALQQLLASPLPLRQLHLRGLARFKLPLDMSHLTRLEDLDLDTSAWLAADTVLPRQLQRLRLPRGKHCQLHGPALAAVMPLQQLTSLSFEVGCREQQPLLRLAQLPALQHLCLEYDGTPECVATSPAWAQLPQLQTLNVCLFHFYRGAPKRVAEAIVAGVAAATTLTSLTLALMGNDDTRHDFDVCARLAGLIRLKYLHLWCSPWARSPDDGDYVAGDPLALTALTGLTWLCINTDMPGDRARCKEEEEGLHGVFKRQRRNGHQLEKGCCKQLSSDCHSKRG
jgi:hypothetical protein